MRRLKHCLKNWPEAATGEYNPACCRWPKSCSATVYDPAQVTDANLEPEAPGPTVRTRWTRSGWDDTRCPRDGQMVNVRCWNCGWVRPTDEDEKVETVPAKTAWTVPATVVRVVDGDTLMLLLDLGWHITMEARCRLIGINCPEMNTPAGVAAKIFAEATLNEVWNRVTFVSHSLDKYGRPLGQVLLPGGASLNMMLLGAGHGVPMEG